MNYKLKLHNIFNISYGVYNENFEDWDPDKSLGNKTEFGKEDRDPTGYFTYDLDEDMFVISHLGTPIKKTSNFDIVKNFMQWQAIVKPDEMHNWAPFEDNIPLYKGVKSNPGILGYTVDGRTPGFTSLKKSHAEMFGDLYIIDPGKISILDEGVALSGEHGSIVFLPGVPSVLRSGHEVVVLQPARWNRI